MIECVGAQRCAVDAPPSKRQLMTQLSYAMPSGPACTSAARCSNWVARRREKSTPESARIPHTAEVAAEAYAPGDELHAHAHARRVHRDSDAECTWIDRATDAVSIMGAGAHGGTAAAYWTSYSNSNAETTTWRRNDPRDGRPSLLTSAGGDADGIVQVFAPLDTNTGALRFTIEVMVLAGQVGGTLGNGGWGGGDTSASGETGLHWRTLTGCGRTDGKNNEVFLYATGGTPAVFYTPNASVVRDDAGCGGRAAPPLTCPAHAADGSSCTGALENCSYPNACGGTDTWHCKDGTWMINSCTSCCAP